MRSGCAPGKLETSHCSSRLRFRLNRYGALVPPGGIGAPPFGVSVAATFVWYNHPLRRVAPSVGVVEDTRLVGGTSCPSEGATRRSQMENNLRRNNKSRNRASTPIPTPPRHESQQGTSPFDEPFGEQPPEGDL